jgi:hypothetical protein
MPAPQRGRDAWWGWARWDRLPAAGGSRPVRRSTWNGSDKTQPFAALDAAERERQGPWLAAIVPTRD